MSCVAEGVTAGGLAGDGFVDGTTGVLGIVVAGLADVADGLVMAGCPGVVGCPGVHPDRRTVAPRSATTRSRRLVVVRPASLNGRIISCMPTSCPVGAETLPSGARPVGGRGSGPQTRVGTPSLSSWRATPLSSRRAASGSPPYRQRAPRGTVKRSKTEVLPMG